MIDIYTYNTHTYTHTRISARKKNEIMLFAATWMEDLEIIILSEVRQRKTKII